MFPLEHYGHYPFHHVSIWGLAMHDLRVQYLSCNNVATHAEREDGQLSFRHLARADGVYDKLDGKRHLYMRATQMPTSCILICIRGGKPKEITVDLQQDNRKYQWAKCTAMQSFVLRDDNGGEWYSISLKAYTNNRDVLTYSRESCIFFDSPLFCNVLNLAIGIEWEKVAHSVEFYRRSFDVVRAGQGVTIAYFDQ
jgi:hypothetical protein